MSVATPLTQQEIKAEFELLAYELVFAHLKWTLFNELFGTKEGVEVLTWS